MCIRDRSNTAPLYCSVPLILTLHDIIFLEKRAASNISIYQNMGWYYRRFIVPRILPKCKKIITVSQFECNHILETLDLSEQQIIAIHNGYNQRFHPLENVSEIIRKYIPHDDYLFFLGKMCIRDRFSTIQIYRRRRLLSEVIDYKTNRETSFYK